MSGGLEADESMWWWQTGGTRPFVPRTQFWWMRLVSAPAPLLGIRTLGGE
jgi:hypothetical protein